MKRPLTPDKPISGQLGDWMEYADHLEAENKQLLEKFEQLKIAYDLIQEEIKKI